jgi:hypothetical protein
MRKSKDWLDRNHDNASEWSDMSIHGLLFQWASNMKICLYYIVIDIDNVIFRKRDFQNWHCFILSWYISWFYFYGILTLNYQHWNENLKNTTVSVSNQKMIETEAKSLPWQTYDRSLSWLSTGTLIISAGVKLVL